MFVSCETWLHMKRAVFMKTTEKQLLGNLGESISVRFLMKHGFSIICRNYRKKWGEIDIIAQRAGNLHFVEVKTVSSETKESLKIIGFRNHDSESLRARSGIVAHETIFSLFSGFLPKPYRYTIINTADKEGRLVSDETSSYRPEDNLHSFKLKRLQRTIQTYLAQKGISEDSDWFFDVITVRLNEKQKTAAIEFLEDVTL